MENLKETVKPFYTELLIANSLERVEQVIDTLIADNFQHIDTAETHDKAQFKEHISDATKDVAPSGDGNLSGYRRGAERKKALLEKEKQNFGE